MLLRIKMVELRWFLHLVRIPLGLLPGEVFGALYQMPICLNPDMW